MRKSFSASGFAVLSTALFLVFCASVQAYTVSGGVRAETNGIVAVDREVYLVDGLVYSDDWGSVVGESQTADSGYFTNISTALLGVFSSATDGDPEAYTSGPRAYVHASFGDTITFTVPEGTYPAGVYASLAGFVSGHVEAVGAYGGQHSTVGANGALTFGSTGDDYAFTFNETAKGIGPTHIVVNETFTLAQQLVAPGQTVPAGGLQIDRSVSASLLSSGAALHLGYVHPDIPDASWIIGDFYNAAGFTSLSVPAGVTWSSDSGVFLSQPDTDTDGVADALDNCLHVPNHNQVDADADGLGNLCDADLNQDCNVNFLDLALLKGVFFSADPVADFDCSGSVNFEDLVLMKQGFFQAPGPGAEPNLCSP